MKKLKLAPGVEIALLKRRIKALEHFLEASEHQVEELHRDRIQARALLHPNAVAVYKAAMRAFRAQLQGGATVNELLRKSWTKEGIALLRACARAAKMAKTGRGGRGK